jgi:hypothetical protein
MSIETSKQKDRKNEKKTLIVRETVVGATVVRELRNFRKGTFRSLATIESGRPMKKNWVRMKIITFTSSNCVTIHNSSCKSGIRTIITTHPIQAKYGKKSAILLIRKANKITAIKTIGLISFGVTMAKDNIPAKRK